MQPSHGHIDIGTPFGSPFLSSPVYKEKERNSFSSRESLMSGGNIVLNDEQSMALKAMESGQNVFLTGYAGTGKSTVVKRFLKDNRKNICALAPTGVAALNIGGDTIHRFFSLGLGIQEPAKLKNWSHRKARAAGKTDIFLIDEVSMVRADLLAAIDERLKSAVKKSEKDLPFGGKQMIFVGDFAQLPPVVKGDEKKYFKDVYGVPYVFAAESWRRGNVETFRLEKVMRSDDPRFLNALNKIRVGNPEGLKPFNDRKGIMPPENTVTITTTNRSADGINADRLNEIKGKGKTYTAVKSGRVRKEPVPSTIGLKIGARVIMVANGYEQKNDSIMLKFVNGDTGTITSLGEECITVKLDRGGEVGVAPHEWEEIEYQYDPLLKNLEKTVTGTFNQLPVRLGWGITIHKSQGMTIPKLTIDFRHRGCFSHGQLYVALSRAIGLEGFWIKGKIRKKDLIVDPNVAVFEAAC